MSQEGYFKTIMASELPPGSMKTVEVAGEGVLLANVDGQFYGMGAYCTHEDWDLSEGSLEGTKVYCAGHGTIWDIRTGQGEFRDPVKNEPLYDVQVKDGYLYVKKRI